MVRTRLIVFSPLDFEFPQLELCDSAYSSLPQAAAAAPPSSSTSPPPPPPPIATTSTTASIPPPRPPPLFSTSPIPCGELYQPTSHQSHLCISTYFSRLEPALELFLPGPTVAHRFLQECNAHWASVDANGNGNGAGDPTTTTRTMTKGWRSMYLASMAMGAMAMTEAEWASIGCTENKTRAGATWLEEAGRLLVESGEFARAPATTQPSSKRFLFFSLLTPLFFATIGFARKPTCESEQTLSLSFTGDTSEFESAFLTSPAVFSQLSAPASW